MHLVVAIGAENREFPVRVQVEREFGMGTQVGRLVLSAAIHQRQRMVDLVGIGETVPTTVAVALGAKCGIPCLSRVEGLLHVIDSSQVLLHVAEHAHLNRQQVVEHALIHVHVARQVVKFAMQDDCVMVHISQ